MDSAADRAREAVAAEVARRPRQASSASAPKSGWPVRAA